MEAKPLMTISESLHLKALFGLSQFPAFDPPICFIDSYWFHSSTVNHCSIHPTMQDDQEKGKRFFG